MNISRRGFLKSCLALAAAPAVIRAESLMKIWTPPQEVWVPPTFTGEQATLDLYGAQIERAPFTENRFIASVFYRKPGSEAWERNVFHVEGPLAPIMRITPQGDVTVTGCVTQAYRTTATNPCVGVEPTQLSGREGSYIELGSEQGVNMHAAGLCLPAPTYVPAGHHINFPLRGERPFECVIAPNSSEFTGNTWSLK